LKDVSEPYHCETLVFPSIFLAHIKVG